MSIRNKGLVLAMEEDTQDEVMVAGPEDQTTVELGSAIDEVAEQGSEIEELNTAIEDAVEDADTLERIGDTMEASAEEGEGMDETAAEIAEIAVESICARLGIRNAKVVPATESFGSRNSRATATRVAVEGVVETVKKAWEAIKEAVKKMWAKIVEFYKSVFDGNVKMRKRAEAMAEKVRAAGNEKEKDEIENAAVSKAFIGKESNILTILGNQLAMTETGSELAEDIAKDLEKLPEAMGKVGGVVKFIQNSNALTMPNKQSFKSLSAAEIKKIGLPDNVLAKISDVLVGGKAFVISLSDKKNYETGDMDLMMKFSEVDHPSAKTSEDTSLKVASKQDLTKICDAVGELAAASEAFAKKFGDIKKFSSKYDRIFAEGEKVLAASKKGVDKEGEDTAVMKEFKEIRRIMIQISSANQAVLTKTPAYNLRAGNAALNYVSMCVAQYK